MDDIAAFSGPPHMLLVEDEALIRLMAVDMLEMLGNGVLEAGTGAEALAMVRDHPIDAMMIDLGLPDRPGEDVIREVLRLRPGLPVIVTTGSDTIAARHRLNDCGIIYFLEKPYDFKDLERTLAAVAAIGAGVAQP